MSAGVAAAGVGAGGGLLGAGLGWGAAASEGNKAWRRQKTLAQNAIRWRVNDMRAAGINPILAVSPGAGASAAGVNMPRPPDFAGAMSQGARAGMEAFMSGAEKRKKKTAGDVNSAQAGLMNSQAAERRRMAGLISEQMVTERHRRHALDRQAERDANQSRLYDFEAQAAGERVHAARGLGEMWTNPFTKKAMQAKELIRGLMSPLELPVPKGRRLR